VRFDANGPVLCVPAVPVHPPGLTAQVVAAVESQLMVADALKAIAQLWLAPLHAIVTVGEGLTGSLLQLTAVKRTSASAV
jgi:hypothetical protein